MVTEKQPPLNDGPSLHDYVETRFNLLTVLIDKLEASLLVRIENCSVREGNIEKALEGQIAHLTQLFTITKTSTDRATDKFEASQAAHNVAQNEWRGTVNDFKKDTVQRPEYDRLVHDMAALTLTITKLQGERTGVKDSKDSNMGLMGLIVGAVAAIAAFAAVVLAVLKP